jgi:glycosyltransferase involved in cell wall biosynthesis
VSIVIPVRNEARHLAACLQSILEQDYPSERLEILVVDGMSQDGTRQIVEQFRRRHHLIRLLDNPARIVPAGLNIGVRAAQGGIILRVDGHSVMSSGYLRRCVELFDRTGADVIGGRVIHGGEGYLGEAVSLVLGSRFGTGNSRFRHGDEPGEADTVANAAYRRAVFERFGRFDERLSRNQDIEFSARVRRGGGRIHFDPELRTLYYSRPTLSGFARQAFVNGRWNVITERLRPGSLSMRHFVPLGFVGALGVAALLGALGLGWGWLMAIVAAYVVAAIGASALQAMTHGLRFLPALPGLFVVLHVAYGLGSIWGITRALRVDSSVPNRDQPLQPTQGGI